MSAPDCTLVSGCFDMERYHGGTFSLGKITKAIEAITEMPCYIVFFGDNITIPILKERRKMFNLTHLSMFIETQLDNLWSFQYLQKVIENRGKYFPTKDERTCAETHLLVINKFDFLSQIIELNPFNTSKFGWLDAFLTTEQKKCRISENYTPFTILNILNNINDKYHIQILNVNDKKYKLDENKEDYYQTYRYVVCGGFFTCGKVIGLKILARLKEVFINTTNLGYGHGEEMCHLEILDEFYDDIERSYGDYGQIFDNFIEPTKNIRYIYQLILKSYVDKCYYKEAYDCSTKLLKMIETFRVFPGYDLYMDILFMHYLTIYYYKPNETKDFVNHIIKLRQYNPYIEQEYTKKKDFYDQQFGYAK